MSVASAMRRKGIWLLAAMVLAGACREAPPPERDAVWRAADALVTDYSSSEPRRVMLWVRVVNQSAAVRGLCVRSSAFTISHPDYQNVGSGGGGACSDAAGFTLVAPEQSHFVPIPITREDLDLGDAELSVRLLLVDAPVPHLHPANDVPLEWRAAVGAIALAP